MKKEKSNKIFEFRKIPFKDKEFTRFLKEENAFWPYVRCMQNNHSINFQEETISIPLYIRRFKNARNYIFDGFPCRSNEFANLKVDWMIIASRWNAKRLKT